MRKTSNRVTTGILGVLLLVFAALLTGCPSVPETYVRADRLTFEAVTPEYLDYVDADADLSEDDKQSRRDTVATWDLRLKKAEAQDGS